MQSFRVLVLTVSQTAAILLSLVVLSGVPATAQGISTDPLPSWNDGAIKQSILDFVGRVTKDGGPDFVPSASRIATFDNDGTLWTEQPMYTELVFSLARVKELAPEHPEWQTQQPFAAVLHGDMKTLAESGNRGMFEIVAATHGGMTAEQFSKHVVEFLSHAEHPKFKRPYTQCVYQPMLEVLSYLRANGFIIYIVSGGEVGFMRPWTEKVYGIPPEHVIGTTLKSKFQMQGDSATVERMPELGKVDDGPGKPENINTIIGKRPILAFGNSDGDKQMLEWTASGTSPHLMLLVHHTDAEREYAYDRTSSVGKLDKALDEATARYWTVVDMKKDWKTIFPGNRTQ